MLDFSCLVSKDLTVSKRIQSLYEIADTHVMEKNWAYCDKILGLLKTHDIETQIHYAALIAFVPFRSHLSEWASYLSHIEKLFTEKYGEEKARSIVGPFEKTFSYWKLK